MILPYIFLFMAILSTALGQVFYKKHTLSKSVQYLVLTLGFFLITPVFSFFALQKISVDIVYVSTSLTILTVAVFSRFLLGEIIPARSWLAIAIIVTGVVIYAA